MRLVTTGVLIAACVLALGLAAVASGRPADPETSAADLLVGTIVQLDPGVQHRLSPSRAAARFLRYQPDAHVDTLRLVGDESAACAMEPLLGCPVSHGRSPIWLIEASGVLRYCPRNGSMPCPVFARHGFATIGDQSGEIVGFGARG
jgi:hypothetical protein